MKRPHVVIVGGGFGGLNVAQALANKPVDVTVIDRANHHLFQPLLYQVATAGLSPADIAGPIRSILRRGRNNEVLMAEVVGLDTEAKNVLLENAAAIPYDYLVLATGSRHSYFGHPEWEALAPGLKTVDDATLIRRKILLAYEKAEMAASQEEQQQYLTFVIVGGGPTGVELAGSIGELSRRTLVKDFDHINPAFTRIILVEAGPRIMAAFPEHLAAKARRYLTELGVEVRENTAVEDIQEWGVRTSAGEILARTVIWAAGVQASPVAKWLGTKGDRAGRVEVQPDLTVPTYPNIYVIGDAALSIGQDGKPLPGVAPVAMQQGRYVARSILQKIHARTLPPFRYFNKGDLATIGRRRAIAVIGGRQLSGWIAWMVWLFVHIMYLATFRNRVSVLVQWAWAYITWERGARLITPVDHGPINDRRPQEEDT